VRNGQDREYYSPLEEGERRIRLRRLDDLLGALEDLNLREQGQLPPGLRDRLLIEGIPVQSSSTVTDLLDMVLSSQEQYMLKERRTGPRRRRLSFIPTDDELVQVLASRFRR
jgi:hypothetical protein